MASIIGTLEIGYGGNDPYKLLETDTGSSLLDDPGFKGNGSLDGGGSGFREFDDPVFILPKDPVAPIENRETTQEDSVSGSLEEPFVFAQSDMLGILILAGLFWLALRRK